MTVALFVDELQSLFNGQPQSQSLLQQMVMCAEAPNVATFFTSSVYHDNLPLQGKMLVMRMSPITTRQELAATQPLWHASWRDDSEYKGLTASELQQALETRIFLSTGGVLRSMFRCSREEEEAQCLVEPPMGSPALALLALLYSVNRSALEKRASLAVTDAQSAGKDAAAVETERKAALIFDQQEVAMADMCNAVRGESHADTATIHNLADSGWLLLKGAAVNEVGTFLRPRHYHLMERVSLHLTLLERAAVHFPEGRMLRQQWEVFYAEHLVDAHPREDDLRWFDSGRPRHLPLFHHQQRHTEKFFSDHQRSIFKPYPDTIGYGQHALYTARMQLTAVPLSAHRL